MKILNCVLVFFLTSLSIAFGKPNPKVIVLEIKAEIDPRMLRYVNLGLEYAEEKGADYVIIDMDTYGGTVIDAKEIVDRMRKYKNPIWVFINSDAASAGALISIACDSIYMSSGATIGAATVVEGAGGDAAPDKYQSYMRSIMRSTAERNGRNPRIAEGMVDQDITIDSIKEAGKVITFTTDEAIKYHYCEGKVESIEEILQKNNIENYSIDYFKLSLTERIISFFLNPFISGLLILIIIGGIYFELQTPGIGFPIFAAIVAMILYLVPYYLNGMAENWEIIALFVGIVLIFVEIFVIPGFGIIGIAGIVLTMTSLFLIMLNNDFFNFDFVLPSDFIIALGVVFGGFLGATALIIFGGYKVLNTGIFKRLILSDTQNTNQGYTSNFLDKSFVGKTGNAFTILRPSGKVIIDDNIYDATTRGECIEKGEKISVIEEVGSTLRVKKNDQ